MELRISTNQQRIRHYRSAGLDLAGVEDCDAKGRRRIDHRKIVETIESESVWRREGDIAKLIGGGAQCHGGSRAAGAIQVSLEEFGYSKRRIGVARPQFAGDAESDRKRQLNRFRPIVR